ncbi:MAG TPA: Arc family DNA-binding protein [Blastocatellia bacterium]|nr:Arc family DNA-binding protein [Blastocatellia bacterium]
MILLPKGDVIRSNAYHHGVQTSPGKPKYAWKPYPLRIPPELKLKLQASATTHHRSLNSEILIRLQGSFPEWRQL